MTESLASKLRLPRYSLTILVESAYSGCGSRHYIQTTLESHYDPLLLVTLKFSVVPKIKLSQPPQHKAEILREPVLKNLQLGDPDLGDPLDVITSSVNRCACITQNYCYLPEAKLAITRTINNQVTIK